jgi:hypothetical protein
MCLPLAFGYYRTGERAALIAAGGSAYHFSIFRLDFISLPGWEDPSPISRASPTGFFFLDTDVGECAVVALSWG